MNNNQNHSIMTQEKYYELEQDVQSYNKNNSRIEKGAAAASTIASFLNGAGYEQVQNFLLQMTEKEHRTLQQLYFNLVLQSIKKFATLPENCIDPRNQCSVKKAQKIYEFMQNEDISIQSPMV